MRDTLKRNDTIYKEIENFEDYELTQCVAYEMMIRNDEFQKNKIILIALSERFHRKGGKEFTELMIKVMKKLKQNSYLQYTQNLTVLDDELFRDYALRMEKKWGVSLNEIVNSENSEMLFLFDKNMMYINGKSIEYDLKDEEIDKTKPIITKYELSYSRPTIEYTNYSKIVEIKLNLSLPKNELLAQLSKIKDIADNGDIKTPMTMFEELQKADNLVCDTKGKCFDTRVILSKQQKITDMFYIYDCLQRGATQRKIQNEIYNYYADKGVETQTMDNKTLKKYKEIAIDYIDNMRYKELITGVRL